MNGHAPSRVERMRAWVDDWRREGQVLPESRLRRGTRFWIHVVRLFIRNRGPVRASALAYTTLLALVPLLAISLSAAALFLPRTEVERRIQLSVWIESAVARAAPTLGLSHEDGTDQRKRVADRIVSFVERIHFKTIGAAATAGLLVVAIGLLRAVEVTFNDIWGVKQSRSLGISIIYYWAILTLGPVIVLAAKGANYLQLLDGPTSALAGSHLAPIISILAYLVFPGIMCLVFGALYWSMPNTRVPWQAALAGGAVASVLWTLNGKLSALYNTRILTDNAIYGSLGVLPLFLVGLYVTWVVVLFGAQVACALQNRRSAFPSDSGEPPSVVAREISAVRIMGRIAAGFEAGQSPLQADALSSQLGIPSNLAGELLRCLVQSRLLNETLHSPPGFTPSRPLQQTSVRDVLQAIRSPLGAWNPGATADAADQAARRALNAVASASDGAAESITLDTLIREARRERAGREIHSCAAPDLSEKPSQ
ncbi:MAG: hypothetical protein RIS76_3060 [Verrucomicrobiota bacterium]